MDFAQSYSCSFSMWSVDPTTWLDVSRVMDFDGLSYEADSSDAAIESAACTVGEDPSQLAWVRVYLETTQDGAHERWPLFTGHVTAPERSVNGTESRWPLELSSVLSPASRDYPELGYSTPAGADVAGEVTRMLASYTPAPVNVSQAGDHMLEAPMVSEASWTVLDHCHKLMAAVEGLRLRIDGDGTVTATDSASPVMTLDSGLNDIVMPELTDRMDRSASVNRFQAVDGNSSATWEDADDIARRGVVTERDYSVSLTGDETLAEYAARVGRERQAVARTVSYTREFSPLAHVGDVVRIDLPAQEIVGLFRITRQSIDWEQGGQVQEEAVYVE